MTEWRPIPGYEGIYEVSDDGSVRSLDRRIWNSSNQAWQSFRGRTLKPMLGSDWGHLNVRLYLQGKGRMAKVHRLVLQAFVGPCPEGRECCHRDGDASNNRVENLYWGTHKENMQDELRHGRNFYVNKTHCKRGHEFTPENLVLMKGPGRQCRICANMTKRVRRAKANRAAYERASQLIRSSEVSA